jgi:hypothetical protein
MAKKNPTSVDQGIKLNKKASAVTYNEKTEGLVYNNNDTELRTHIEGADREVLTADQTSTVTNKVIDVDNNTVSNIEVDNLKAGVLDTDLTSVSASDDTIPSAKATKTALDLKATDADLTTHISDTTTHGTTGDIVGTSDSQVLTNKTIDADLSTISNIGDEELKAGIDAAKLADGSVSNAELQYINSVTSNVQTQINAKADDSALTTHISDTTTHGTTGNIVGTSDAQVLTNKTIDADLSTISNIGNEEIKAGVDAVKLADGSVTNAELQYINSLSSNAQTQIDGKADTTGTAENTFAIGDNLDTNKVIEFDNGDANNPAIRFNASGNALEFANDGVTFQEFGSGGGGGGGLDIFMSESFEVTLVGAMLSGNNATFLGGGVLAGTLSYETVSPLSGNNSLKYVQASGSVNDYVALPNQTLDPKQQGNDLGFVQSFTYDGDDDDIKLVVWDVTNGQDLTDSLALYKSQSNSKRYTAQVFAPTNCASIHVGFQTLVENIGATLLVDDVEGSNDPFVYQDLLDQEDGRYDGYAGVGATNTSIIYFTNERSNNTGALVSVENSSTNGFSITALKDNVTISASFIARLASAATTEIGWSLNSTQLTTGIGSITAADRVGYSIELANTTTCEAPVDIVLNKDDVLRTHRGSSALNSVYTIMTFTATAETAAVVHAGSGTENTFSARIANNGTASITSQSGGDNPAIASVNRPSIGVVDITFTSGFFVTVPSVVIDPEITGARTGVMTSISTTTCSIKTQNSTTGVNVDENFTITFTRQGADYKNPNAYAITPLTRTCYIKDVKTSGTAGGAFNNGAWQPRVANTLSGDTSFCILSNGTTGTDGTATQFTLPAGKYEIEADACAYEVDAHRLKIRNITDSTDEIFSINLSTGTLSDTDVASLKGSIEITAPKVFELQHKCVSTRVSTGFGVASSLADEVYVVIKITKIL